MLVMLDTSHRHRLRIRVNLLRSTTVSLIRALAKDTIPKVHAYPSVLAQLRRHPLPSSLASVLSDTLVLSVRDAMVSSFFLSLSISLSLFLSYLLFLCDIFTFVMIYDR